MINNLQFYRRNIRVLYWSQFARSLVFIVPIWVSFERQYINYSQVIFLQGVIFLAQLLLELPTGAFADLVGRKVSVGLGYLTMALGAVVFSF